AEICVAIAAIIGAVSGLIAKLQLESISLGIFSIYRNILGTIVFFIIANLLYGPDHFAEAWSPFLWQWMLIYALIIVVIGKLCWLAGLKKVSQIELNLANLLIPIIAIVMAYFILNEIPTFAQYVGGIFLLIGLIFSFIGNIYQVKSDQKSTNPKPREAMDEFVGFRGV
ncbi:MAG: DMT family transporter, partial [Microcystaceae cyanobacterium]